MGNGISRRRNRQEWTPGKEKRGSKDRSDSNGTSHGKSSVETTSATKIDGGSDGANGSSVAPVATAIPTSTEQAEATGEKADIESTPPAVDQDSSAMESTPEAPVQTDVPPEPPKSEPPTDTAAAPPAPAETQVSQTATEEAAVMKSEEQTSPAVPEVRVDNVVKQDQPIIDVDRIVEEVTAEGIKLAADIIRTNPVASESETTSEPAAPTPEPTAESAPTPEPTADSLPCPVPPPAEAATEVPAESVVAEQPKAEEVKEEEPVAEQVAVKSAEQVAEDRSLLIESSASAADANAVLSAKEPEATVKVQEPEETPASEGPATIAAEEQPKAEEPVATLEPEKAAKSADEQAAERQSVIDSAATTAVTNGILLKAAESKESVVKPEAAEAEEKKEADSAPADPVPNASIPSETPAPEECEPVAAAVDTVVPNGEVKVNDAGKEPEEPVHENNNASKGDAEAAATAATEVPTPVET